MSSMQNPQPQNGHKKQLDHLKYRVLAILPWHGQPPTTSSPLTVSFTPHPRFKNIPLPLIRNQPIRGSKIRAIISIRPSSFRIMQHTRLLRTQKNSHNYPAFFCASRFRRNSSNGVAGFSTTGGSSSSNSAEI